MIAMQPEQVVAYSSAVKGILGLHPIFFWALVSVVIIGAGLYVFLRERERRKREFNRQIANKTVAAEFTTEEGNAYTKICIVENRQIKEFLDKGKKYPLTSLFVEKEGKPRIESYIVDDKYAYLMDYPPFANPAQQVKIRKLYYKENDPHPKLRMEDKELTRKEEKEISARITYLAQQEKELSMLLGEIDKQYEKWEHILGKVKYTVWILLIVVIDALLDVSDLILDVLASGKIQQILTAIIAFSGLK